jgi:hypothetical protein
MRPAAAVTLGLLTLAIGSCGDDFPTTGSTKSPTEAPKPEITVVGTRTGDLHRSPFVTCLERAGFTVTVRPDRGRSASTPGLYFYEWEAQTPQQHEDIDRCSDRLAQDPVAREDQLGVATPEIEHVKRPKDR